MSKRYSEPIEFEYGWVINETLPSGEVVEYGYPNEAAAWAAYNEMTGADGKPS